MIEFKNIRKVYSQNQVAVDNVNLKFEDDEFICFIGTSGSGKTTCMRMINRMNEPTEGEILINGKNIIDMDPVKLRRKIGYVIQQIGLLPHMTIYENIAIVPRLLDWNEEKIKKTAESLIDRVDLPRDYLEKYPSELSGGQQQRVGVIRALAADQDIILMDEPFGALDPITRDSLQKLVKKLQKEMGKTIVFVSHDMDEALALADRIVIMDKGKVIQFDSPENILKNPKNDYVRNLIGEDKINEAKTAYQSVDTIMIKDPVYISEDKSAYEAISLMKERRVDMLYLLDKNKVLKGAVGIYDLGKGGRNVKDLREIMTRPYYIKKDAKIMDAINQILELDIKNLAVVDDDHHLLGIVTRASVVDIIYNNLWGDSLVGDDD